MVKIRGKVLEENTGEPIANAQIDLEYDSLYFRNYSDNEGNYELFVPVNKDFEVSILKEGKKISGQTYFVDIFFRDTEDRNYDLIAQTDTGDTQLIHVEMKNDYEENSAIASIAHDEISHWSDSLNNLYEQRRIAEYVPGPGSLTVFFDYNSYDLGVSGKNELKELYVDILEGRTFSVYVEGHADARGSLAYNEKLSHKRAQTVAKYLYSLGLNKNNVIIDGHGETKLLKEGDTEDSHAKNRRVEVIFKN